MSTNLEFIKSTLALRVMNAKLEVAAIYRSGHLEPIVFLHGFGSTKEDYADIVRYGAFAGHPFLAYDAPGCGETRCCELSKISIPFLVATALAVLQTIKFERFHLIGHSMGGLTGLMLAHEHPGRVLSFIDIEGNVAPEDCFLSRQILEHPREDPELFFADFIERARHAPAYASALYASSLRNKVRAAAVPGIFRSMVDLSDNGDLMQKFLGLHCPKMFMYGAQNASLSYLSHIHSRGVRLCEVPQCGHFPMYSNPVFMWQEIAAFHRSFRSKIGSVRARADGCDLLRIRGLFTDAFVAPLFVSALKRLDSVASAFSRWVDTRLVGDTNRHRRV